MLSANLAFRYSADLQSLAYERKEKMTSQLGFLLMLAVVVIAGGTLGFRSNQDNPTWGGGLNWTMYVLGFLAYLGGRGCYISPLRQMRFWAITHIRP